MSARFVHTCIRVKDIEASVAFCGRLDREEYRTCFVANSDGYRIELIDRAFPTPQDPPHRSTR